MCGRMVWCVNVKFSNIRNIYIVCTVKRHLVGFEVSTTVDMNNVIYWGEFSIEPSGCMKFWETVECPSD
jgi:hypothetical protein